MKVLVTGATGFLGKYIIDELVENNYKVVAFGRNEKVGKSLENENVRFFKGDFTEKEDIIKIMNSQKSPESKINADLNHENQTKSDLKVSRKYHTEEISAVIHAGGLSTVWGKWQDFYNSNVKGTENILEICRIYKIKKLIFISSPSIYAEPKDQVNVREEEAPEENNLNFYIKSKIMAEKKIKEYADIPSVIIRPRGLFGVGDTSVIPRLLKLNRTKGIPLFNDGKQMVAVTCVENAAFAIRLALESENSSGQIYNITNNEPMAFKNILELFFKEFGEKPHFIRKNYNTVKFFVNVIEKIYHLFGITKEPPITMYTLYLMRYSQTLNIEKAEKELNYKPKLTIAEGVKKYVENNRKN